MSAFDVHPEVETVDVCEKLLALGVMNSGSVELRRFRGHRFAALLTNVNADSTDNLPMKNNLNPKERPERPDFHTNQPSQLADEP